MNILNNWKDILKLPLLTQFKVASLTVLLFSQNVFAYNIYRNCGFNPGSADVFSWSNPNVQMVGRLSDFSFVRRSRINAAAAKFSEVGGASIDVNVTFTNAGPGGGQPAFIYGNGRNEIYWNNGAASGTTVAVAKYTAASGNTNGCTNVQDPSGFLIEGDIWMNSTTNWSTNLTPYLSAAQNPVSILRVTMHELGHIVGLSGRSVDSVGNNTGQAGSHDDGMVATMNSTVQNGNILGGNGSENILGSYRNKLHADDAAGLRVLYPDSTTKYDVAGSRFSNGPNGTVVINNNVGTTSIRRGNGYNLPYTLENLGTQTVDVRVDVWMTTDGVLNGAGDDIQITNNGSPLYHLYTMNPLGRIPGTGVNTSQRSTREGSIYFEIPNDAETFSNDSNWLIGYHVTMPYLPGGAFDVEAQDNWVSLKSPHTIVP